MNNTNLYHIFYIITILFMAVFFLFKSTPLVRPTYESALIDPKILSAIITIESNNNPLAYNNKTKDVGLMQLSPVVYGKICGMTQQEAFDIQKNIACGSLYFKSLLDRFHGNLEKALEFYNSGNRGSMSYVSKIKKELDKHK